MESESLRQCPGFAVAATIARGVSHVGVRCPCRYFWALLRPDKILLHRLEKKPDRPDIRVIYRLSSRAHAFWQFIKATERLPQSHMCQVTGI
jgi:hypothetical protein